MNLDDLAANYPHFKLIKTRQDGDFHGTNAIQFSTSR